MEQVLFVVVAGFWAFAFLFVALFVLSKHIIQTANWVYSVFLLRTVILPSVLSFYVKHTNKCEADSLFSGGEAQLWPVLEPSWIGLPYWYVIVCVQLCMCVAACSQNCSHMRKDVLMQLLSEGAQRISPFCNKAIPKLH